MVLSLCDVVSPLCDVVSSLCDVVLPLCDVVSKEPMTHGLLAPGFHHYVVWFCHYVVLSLCGFAIM